MRKPLPTDDLDFIVERTHAVWSSLGHARFFITGGTGFIGSWLLEAIQHANRTLGVGIEAVVLSRDPDRARAMAPHLYDDHSIQLMRGDVMSFETARAGAIDACIHAATDVADPSKAGDALRAFDTGVVGTRRVLDLAQASSAKHFLLTSSGAVYGRQPSMLAHMPETYAGAPSPLDSASTYGQTKRVTEWLASVYAGESALHVSIARIYALVGPAIPLDGPFAAGNFIRDALAGRQIAIQGDGRPLRSYLYMADACVWLLNVLLFGERGQAYNIGAEREVSILELARMIEALAGSTTLAIPARAPGPGPAPRYVPNTTKARETLGLRETFSLEQALSRTINWQRNAVTV